MKRLPGFALPACFALGALLAACTSDNNRVVLDYLRSPNKFQADTTVSDHPFCDQTNPVGSAEACKLERKYKLTWERPVDTVNFKGYRIYLDTSRDGMNWSTLKNHPELAVAIINREPVDDSLVFVFTDARKSAPDTLSPGQDRILALDSNGRAEPGTGNLVFALVPVYSGGGTPGNPLYSYFVTTDRQPPDVFRPDFRPRPHGIFIAWERPTDRVSFFDPELDTGVILRYVLKVGLEGRKTPDRLSAFRPKLKFYTVGGSDSTAAENHILLFKPNGLPDMMYLLPDGHRSAKHTHPDATDSMYLEIDGMFPEDSLTVQLSAVDSAGNCDSTAMPIVSIRTTDTTQPSQPKLKIESLSQNGFTIIWSASKDTIAGADGQKKEADQYNANIRDYKLTRILVRASGEKTTTLDRVDTTVQDSLPPSRSEFRISVKFLPPGSTYHLSLFAEDSSGYPSPVDTFDVTTLKVAFADTDSVLTCPPGFIPVPRGNFVLGDSSSGEKDESPARPVAMAPYCIEPYEHRDSTGQRFVSNVTYEEARAICKAVNPDFSTELCSEAEWERACEGPASNGPALVHGIQSEDKDPSILQGSCNQATNDSAMALNFSLRNSICLTTEGVYDMAGNLSEWVRDTYVPAAPGSVSRDTLHADHGFVFADSGDIPPRFPPHSIRGGNYLKPNLSQLAAVQKLARCSNRDFPEQVRPIYRDSCRSDDKPRLVVIYGPGFAGHRCYDVKDKYLTPDVTDLIPAPRSDSGILEFHRGVPTPDTIHFQPDTLFKGRKALSAQFTTKALAAVTFERTMPMSGKKNSYEDTLDATEFRDTTQAGLAAIFQREAASPAWTVHKENGKYAIKYIYAYTLLGSKPALPYYSSRAIGFRCCSLAGKAKPPPTDSVAVNP